MSCSRSWAARCIDVGRVYSTGSTWQATAKPRQHHSYTPLRSAGWSQESETAQMFVWLHSLAGIRRLHNHPNINNVLLAYSRLGGFEIAALQRAIFLLLLFASEAGKQQQ